MITITLNGEQRSISEGASIGDLLAELEINNRYCAVERNKQLIPRQDHPDCRLAEGDQIEVVTLVGGG